MKYLIVGAGPAGLTVGNMFQQAIFHGNGGAEYVILEKETDAGGLCRSFNVDGYPLDVGGGHFLDVRRPHVNRFLFEFMPEEEWDQYDRNTTLHINGNVIGQPIEAHIWQMRLEDQVEYLKSIAIAGCNLGEPLPERFIDWIYWKLGKKISEEYMLPYNRKMFGEKLNELGTYWLEKLPNVSFEETLLSCLTKKPYGRDPGHTQFYYPKKYGYGELWRRMAETIKDHVEYECQVDKIDFNSRSVTTVDGRTFAADVIITTIPWIEYNEIIGMPESLVADIRGLKHSSVCIDYYPENMDTDSQWIYYPDERLSYHRILVRHNFCPGSKGYWTETNLSRMKEQDSAFRFINKYAYPLNTVRKPEIMNRLLLWCRGHSVYGLGRWGEHSHYNSDATVDLAMKLAQEVMSC